MESSQVAGWYPDPSGMPDTFRWWDGQRWTQALSPRADAPPPPNPRPVVSDEPETSGGTAATRTDEPAAESGSPEARSGPPPERTDITEPRASTETEAQQRSEHGSDQESPSRDDSARRGHDDEATQPPTPAEPSVEPPPAGAPGPEYLPPPPHPAESASTRPDADSDSEDADAGRQNRRSILILAAVLAMLAGVGVGAWIWWPQQDETEIAEPPRPSPPASTPSPSPSSPSPQNPSPPPSQDEAPSDSARLVFDPLGGDWKKNSRFSLLSNGYAETQVTQSDFDGRNDWLAVATTGTAPPRTRQGDLSEQARAVATWFRGVGFESMKVDTKKVDDKAVTVDDRPAHLFVQRVRYDNSALKSKSDLVTVVVVDMGEDNPPGVFLASVPDTHQKLTVDVDNARRSLHIAE